MTLASQLSDYSTFDQKMFKCLLDLLSQILCDQFNKSLHKSYQCESPVTHFSHDLDLAYLPGLFICSQQQGVTAFFLESLNKLDMPFLSSFAQEQWLKQASTSLARSRLLAKYWPKTIPAPMLIKGADLELSLYEPLGFPPGIRSCSDWDILIPEPYYSQVIKDWQDKFGEGIVPQSSRLKSESPHELGFYIEDLLFEVHRDPAPLSFTSITGEQIWSNRQIQFDAWGQKYYVPSPKCRLVIFLLNYAKGGGQTRLLDWLDLIIIIKALTRTEQKGILNYDSSIDGLNQPQVSRILKDVLEILRETPLIELLINKGNQSDLEIVKDLSLLTASLQRYKDQVRKSILQLRYCESNLRARYIHAKFTK